MANEAARRAAAEKKAKIRAPLVDDGDYGLEFDWKECSIDLQLDLDSALALVAEYRVALDRIRNALLALDDGFLDRQAFVAAVREAVATL